MDLLYFDNSRYKVKTFELDGRTVTYRAFEDIAYCTNPVDPVQKLHIFVPELYYQGKSINGYTLQTAPIFAPNSVGGYMEGPAYEPGIHPISGKPNVVFEGLLHGYVLVCAGVRGRTTGQKTNEYFEGSINNSVTSASGKMVGRAPALIVDMKAVVRYLRHNADLIPGNANHIITSGTSAGGALSSMAGASGNAADYEPYLEAIGAAKERDDIFAANCYCPIHNLENADMAYEWLFHEEEEYKAFKPVKTPDGVNFIPMNGKLTEKQKEVSAQLKAMFPAYVNALALKDESGKQLTLDADGEGSFKEYIRELLKKSAQFELDTHWSANKGKLMLPFAAVERQPYITIKEGKVVDIDWNGFVKAITRMKPAPAFDSLDLGSPENEEFGDENVFAKHFTTFSYENSEVNGAVCDDAVVKMLNATRYIGKADTAKYWRIRHGSFDRDTSLAIPTILALLLQNNGYEVDYHLPWGIPHSGDYDFPELFSWIDEICGKE